ncbi:MAG: protein kinase [Candidatus Nitrosocosmicus sp.]|nr:protein kinase [Candidatus Nitrosocosmicus sp.]
MTDSYTIQCIKPSGIYYPFKNLELPNNTKHQIESSLLVYFQEIKNINNQEKGAVYLVRSQDNQQKNYIIKQGKGKFLKDENGRDMKTRLYFQSIIHQKLSKYIKIPTSLDYFETDEYGYLVLEYIEGYTLGYVLNNVTIKWKSFLFLLYDLLKVIKGLHSFGYIHRDLSPSNILISKSRYMY